MVVPGDHAWRQPHRHGTGKPGGRIGSRLTAAVLGALLFGAGPIPGSSAANAGTAQIQLPESAQTSAGVFDAQDRLIRTLWSGVRKPRGPVQINWDGIDDDGHRASAGPYRVRLLAHNVNYRWQGVIGNTSRDSVGPHVFRSFLPITHMAFDAAGNGFYVVGYNERQPALHRFRPEQPDGQEALGHDDFRRQFHFVATDGSVVYFANEGYKDHTPRDLQRETFVLGLNVSDGSEHVFAAGHHAGEPPESEWQSVIDYNDGRQDLQLQGAPTGLAVQRHGDVLFVAHAGDGEIRLLDKHTGIQRGRIEVAGAGDLGVGPDDSLWVLCRSGSTGVVRHFRLQDGEWRPVGTIEAGIKSPVALGVSPTDGTVVIVDEATEQLRAFDSTGRALWTFGEQGGYQRGGPTVTEERFGFSAGPAYVAFQADGSFWLGDPANERNLHFSADRRYLGEIMYQPHTRVTTVDVGNATRVFSGFQEFEVDYSKPLAQSWRLVRNWSAGLDRRYTGEDMGGLQAVCTLPGGPTLAVVRRFDLQRNEILLLGPQGARSAGLTIDADTRLYPDGSLRQHVIREGRLQIYQRRFMGLDADGKPQWAPFAVLASVSSLQNGDPYYQDVPRIAGINDPTYPQSSRGIVISFSPGKSPGFHLGGILPGRDGWLWRASPAGPWALDGGGNVTPRDGSYEIDNNVQYPGNIVTVAGSNVVFGYHGEGWRNLEADQWVHYHDDGLFIGQFGTPGLWVPSPARATAVAGFAGNAFTPQLVSVAGQVYLWHNDESGHGGVHRWWLEGADAVKEYEAPISP